MILRNHPEIEEDILVALLLTPDVHDLGLYVDLLDLVCHAPKGLQRNHHLFQSVSFSVCHTSIKLE